MKRFPDMATPEPTELRLKDERVDKLCSSAEQLAMDVNVFLTEPLAQARLKVNDLILAQARDVLHQVREIRERQGRG